MKIYVIILPYPHPHIKNNITIAGDLCLLFYVPLDSTSREVNKFRYIPTTLYNYYKNL